MYTSEIVRQSHHKQMVLQKNNNSDESGTDGAFCENPKVCEKDLTARMKHAYVEVTHAVRAITGEIVVMDLYQMVLYVKTVKILDRN